MLARKVRLPAAVAVSETSAVRHGACGALAESLSTDVAFHLARKGCVCTIDADGLEPLTIFVGSVSSVSSVNVFPGSAEKLAA